MNLNRYSRYAPLIIRISLSIVFLWFGINQLIFTEDFISYLPEFLLNTNYAKVITIFNGIFEASFGILLIIGLFKRFAALILGLHLLTIVISLGYNDIAVRDFGLMLVTFSIFLRGPDEWCLDWRKK